MTTDLEQALRGSAADLTLDTPASDVLGRGDRLRRRRRSSIALGVAGVATATTFTVALVGGQPADRAPLDPENPGQGESFRVASWSGSATNVTAEQLGEVRDVCARSGGGGLAEPGWDLPRTTAPAAAELRDGVVLTYFVRGRDYSTCTVRLDDNGGWQVVAQVAGVERTVPADQHVAVVTAGAADPGPVGGALSDVYAVVRVTSDVASVQIAVDGETYDSTTDDLGFFWLPDGAVTQADLDDATVTALDADGEVLYQSRPGAVW